MDASLFGVGLTMFLTFVGFSSGQFHSYLFEHRGVSRFGIGLLLMAGQCAAIVSPFFQVATIRRFHGPRTPFLLVLAGSGIGLAILPHLYGFPALLIGFTLFSFCSAGVFPLNAACAFDAMRARGHAAFFHLRSLGTLGFLVGCLISAFFPHLSDLPLLYAGFAAAVGAAFAAAAWDYRATPAPGPVPARPGLSHALRLLREPRTLRLMILMGAMNFANVMATAMQGNYLVDRWHQSQRVISLAWVVSTACEVPWMLLCAWLLRRSGLRAVLALGLLGTVVKLVGLALAHEAWQYCLALAMHGCFFSGALTGFTIHLDRAFKPTDRPSLQALAPIFYSGVPSGLAGLAAGALWHAYSLRAVYAVAGVVAVLCALYAAVLARVDAARAG
jgi:MFS family permease